MTIFLTILKVIGIILLSLLGLLLFLLLVVLLSPVRYTGWGQRNDCGFKGGIKANWILHSFRVDLQFPDQGTNKVSVLWMNLLNSKKSKDTEEDNETKKAEDNTEDEVKLKNPENSGTKAGLEADKKNESESEQKCETGVKTEPEVKAESEATTESEAQTGTDEDSGEETDKSPKDRTNIQYTFQRIYDKIKMISSEIVFYIELYNDPETIGLVDNFFKRIARVVRSIAPRRIDGHVDYCTGSPDTAAYVFGLYVLLFSRHKGKLVVNPDINGDTKALDADIKIKGHIVPGVTLVNLLFVLFDKRLWQTKKKLQEHRKRENG